MSTRYASVVQKTDTGKSGTAFFVYSLRAVPRDEFEYEYDGPPLTVMEDIVKTTDNDAALRLPGTPRDNTYALDPPNPNQRL